MLTTYRPMSWFRNVFLAMFGRLHVEARLAVKADLDPTIDNVSPPTPIRGSVEQPTR
jgi:hypothetical protein